MSDPKPVPADEPDRFLAGDEPVGNGEDVVAQGSQALMPSDLEEPALLNGESGGDPDAEPLDQRA